MLDSVFGIKQFRNEIIWHYYNAPSNTKNRFGCKHDIVFFYAKSDNNYFNDIEAREPYSKTSNMIKTQNPNGKRIQDVWCMVSINNMAKERLGYPTQKPVALYERMIKASSNQHDIVLDPFAGSGTTLDAAHTLGRQWIGIDIGETAIETIQDRLRNRHGLEYDRDYELNVSHVKTLLSELVNEDKVETHTRNGTLHYRKS